MPNENEGEKKNRTFSTLREIQANNNISNTEKLRDQALENILIDLGGTLKGLFSDINPEALILNANAYNDDVELQATMSLLNVALSTFIDDCKKISTIIQIYQKMNERSASDE